MIARRGCANDLIQLWGDRFEEYKERYIQNITSGIQEMWILEDETTQELCGELHIRWHKPECMEEADGKKRGYLFAFRVNPVYQGKGFGTLLMEGALGSMREKGFLEASVGVEGHEKQLKAMYAHWGFNDLVRENEFEDCFIDQEGKRHNQKVVYEVWVKTL